MQKSLFIEAVRSHRLFETLRSLMSFAVARMRKPIFRRLPPR
ncbi:MAG: hypothetical protein ACLUHG_03005 [Sutterella wadsworthensis]